MYAFPPRRWPVLVPDGNEEPEPRQPPRRLRHHRAHAAAVRPSALDELRHDPGDRPRAVAAAEEMERVRVYYAAEAQAACELDQGLLDHVVLALAAQLLGDDVVLDQPEPPGQDVGIPRPRLPPVLGGQDAQALLVARAHRVM